MLCGLIVQSSLLLRNTTGSSWDYVMSCFDCINKLIHLECTVLCGDYAILSMIVQSCCIEEIGKYLWIIPCLRPL